MAIVVKWRDDGDYFAGRGLGDIGGVWTKSQKRAMRFQSRAEFRRCEREVRQDFPPWDTDKIKFVRIVPRKRSVRQDKLLEIAGLFNGWANGRRVSATKTLKAIGDVLGEPF